MNMKPVTITRDYVRNPKGFTNMQEIEVAAATAASIMKLMCGVGNNATYNVLGNAHEQIKKHSRYKGRVTGLYKKVFKDWRMYESNLLYAEKDRFFRVSDMPEPVRKKYGNITDKEYFEYWLGLGSDVYVKTKPLIGSLTHKFRLSLEAHGVGEADVTAWALTGTACLELACHIYNLAIDSCWDVIGVHKDMLRKLFRPFYLGNISKAWNLATDELAPGIRNYKLDDFEESNISAAFGQIAEIWTNPVTVYDSAYACIGDFPEVFRSKKELRIALAEVNEMKEETIQERKRIKVEQLKKEAV